MSEITNEEIMAALDLSQNKQHQCIVGELAAALNIAMCALNDIANSKGALETLKAKKKASEAVKSIQKLGEWMLGRPDPFDKERLDDLEKDFSHIMHSVQNHKAKP